VQQKKTTGGERCATNKTPEVTNKRGGCMLPSNKNRELGAPNIATLFLFGIKKYKGRKLWQVFYERWEWRSSPESCAYDRQLASAT
jgi:hypothetical protein